MAAEATNDKAALAKLARIGGNAFVQRMIDSILGHAPKMIAEARAGHAAGNLEPVERAGHSLKSSAANLGLPALRAVCIRLEQAAHDRQLESIAGLLDELERAFADAKACLEEARGEYPP